MDNNDIVLDLYKKILELNKRLDELEENNKELRSMIEDKSKVGTRKGSRKYIISMIQEYCEGSDIEVLGRNENADLKITYSGNELYVKIHSSKSHENKSYLNSFHRMLVSDIEDVDVHIFTTLYNNKYHTFLISNEDVISIIKTKKITKDSVFFTFEINGDLIYDKRDYQYDASKYYEDWNLLNELFNNKSVSI